MKAVAIILGLSNGPLKFFSACKIWPLLDLLAKVNRVLACSCSRNFRNSSHVRNFVNGFVGYLVQINVSLRGSELQ